MGANQEAPIEDQIGTVKHRARVALAIGVTAGVLGILAPPALEAAGVNSDVAVGAEIALEGVAAGSIALSSAEVFTMIDLEQEAENPPIVP